MRQVHYSEADEKSLDMVLFLNGVPIFTVELKSKLNGQTVEDAIWQYRRDRDPKEPLFRQGRCLAHFAVDNGPRLYDDVPARHENLFPAFQQGL